MCKSIGSRLMSNYRYFSNPLARPGTTFPKLPIHKRGSSAPFLHPCRTETQITPRQSSILSAMLGCDSKIMRWSLGKGAHTNRPSQHTPAAKKEKYKIKYCLVSTQLHPMKASAEPRVFDVFDVRFLCVCGVSPLLWLSVGDIRNL